MADEDFINRLMKGAKTMLRKRGEQSFEVFETKQGYARTTGNILVYMPEICSEFTLDPTIAKVKNETLHYLYFLMESNHIKHAILIYNDITPPASQMIKEHTHFRIEPFEAQMLLFDPTEHVKTPKHEKMTEEEIKNELRTIKRSELPHIRDDDRIVRYYDWNVGDIIRISRPSGIYYRIVIRT